MEIYLGIILISFLRISSAYARVETSQSLLKKENLARMYKEKRNIYDRN